MGRLRRTEHNQLEIVIRIRAPRGFVLSEWIIRGAKVECIAYWPDGHIGEYVELSVERFYEELTGRAAGGGNA